MCLNNVLKTLLETFKHYKQALNEFTTGYHSLFNMHKMIKTDIFAHILLPGLNQAKMITKLTLKLCQSNYRQKEMSLSMSKHNF